MKIASILATLRKESKRYPNREQYESLHEGVGLRGSYNYGLC